MTPQEKAEKLVDSYRLILIKSDTDAGEEILCTLLAKECALVAVDEVINLGCIEVPYWFEVKQEIGKL